MFPDKMRNWIIRAITLVSAAACFTVAALLVISAGLPQRADYTAYLINENTIIAPEVGAIAPPITLSSLSGETVNLDAMRGDPIIVNFWATWCAPCRVEMQELQKLYDERAADGLHIIAVNLDEPVSLVVDWVDTFDLTYDIVLDTDREIALRYAFRDPPSTFLINPDGEIDEIFYGPVLASALRDKIDQYVD